MLWGWGITETQEALREVVGQSEGKAVLAPCFAGRVSEANWMPCSWDTAKDCCNLAACSQQQLFQPKQNSWGACPKAAGRCGACPPTEKHRCAVRVRLDALCCGAWSRVDPALRERQRDFCGLFPAMLWVQPAMDSFGALWPRRRGAVCWEHWLQARPWPAALPPWPPWPPWQQAQCLSFVAFAKIGFGIMDTRHYLAFSSLSSWLICALLVKRTQVPFLCHPRPREASLLVPGHAGLVLSGEAWKSCRKMWICSVDDTSNQHCISFEKEGFDRNLNRDRNSAWSR